MIADSLRMWVREYHVDGFRFDLAITLARDPVVGYDKGASFLDIVYQDPVLSQVKLIAEHWDVGEYGYQVGNFPPNWSEWNGKYRDTVRKFWKGDKGQLSDFAQRLSGSGDPYRPSGRGPRASVNFVTPTTVSPCAILCRTTTNTTRRMAKITRTVPATTNPGIAEPKATRTMRESGVRARNNSGIFWRR